MARKHKKGLDYFPHNCNLDDSLLYVISVHGATGYYIYFELLARIYSEEGYYCQWDDKNKVLFGRKIAEEIKIIETVLQDCLKEQLFSDKLYKQYQILTSKGIQERYMEAASRRQQVDLIFEYILLADVSTKYENVNIISLRPTKKKTEIKEIESTQDDYPDDFNKIWQVYLAYRRNQKFKKMKDLSEKAAKRKLFTIAAGDPGTAKRIVDQSIENCWQGLFPIKAGNGSEGIAKIMTYEDVLKLHDKDRDIFKKMVQIQTSEKSPRFIEQKYFNPKIHKEVKK